MRRGREGEPVCHFATAYDHWIRFIYGYEDDFLGKSPKPFRKSPTHLEFASKQDNYYLTGLFSSLSIYYEYDFKKESSVSIKWIFNRVLSLLVINNFRCWLAISHEIANSNPVYTEISYNKIKNFNFPLYVLVKLENKNEPLEFHWWNENKLVQNEKVKKIKCPYQ